jgi:ABC-type microcin C transport system permease subunit YejB
MGQYQNYKFLIVNCSFFCDNPFFIYRLLNWFSSSYLVTIHFCIDGVSILAFVVTVHYKYWFFYILCISWIVLFVISVISWLSTSLVCCNTSL